MKNSFQKKYLVGLNINRTKIMIRLRPPDSENELTHNDD